MDSRTNGRTDPFVPWRCVEASIYCFRNHHSIARTCDVLKLQHPVRKDRATEFPKHEKVPRLAHVEQLESEGR